MAINKSHCQWEYRQKYVVLAGDITHILCVKSFLFRRDAKMTTMPLVKKEFFFMVMGNSELIKVRKSENDEVNRVRTIPQVRRVECSDNSMDFCHATFTTELAQ